MSQRLTGAVVLVLGGTGSLGQRLVARLLELPVAGIRVFSRDENKQSSMRQSFGPSPQLRFILGDVRDFQRVRDAMRGVDVVVGAAALKEVPACEDAPMEAVLTNVVGASNVRRAAIELGVQTVVAVSTDKAVEPINVMGMTKALLERVLLVERGPLGETRFVGVRYGNVLGSRGSVVPLLIASIRGNRPLPLTHPDTTRFLLTIDEAVDLIFTAISLGNTGDLFVKQCSAAALVDLARAVINHCGAPSSYPIEFIGYRAGDKIHETLLSRFEMARAIAEDGWFRLPSAPGNSGEVPDEVDFRSDTARRLSIAELEDMVTRSQLTG